MIDIKQRRLSAIPKITLLDLSRASGLSARGINKIENGEIVRPGYQTVMSIESAFVRLEAERAEAAGREVNHVTG